MSNTTPKRIVVLGANGLLGRHFCEESQRRSVPLLAVDLAPSFAGALGSSDAYFSVDLSERGALDGKIASSDWIINLAGAKRSVKRGFTGIGQYLVDMLRIQTEVLHSAFSTDVERFLLVGSINQYPDIAVRDEDAVWDGRPKQNDWMPGIQKRMGEVQATAYFEDTGWDAVRIVRLANIYGPYDKFSDDAHLIPALIYRAVHHPERVEVFGDGANVRDFLFAPDAAYWLYEAAIAAPPLTPINIGSGRGIRVDEVVQAVQSSVEHLLGRQIETVWRATPHNKIDAARVLAVQRAVDLLGFRERTTLLDGIKETVNWYVSREANVHDAR
jgi:nucleoside-diphosphate-sugar epimerase